MRNMKNTKQFSEVTVFIYPKKDRYIGVCLELDLIDEDVDKNILSERMKKRVRSYIAYIKKRNSDDALLNRPAPKRYWNKFYQFLDIMRQEEKKRMSWNTVTGSTVSRAKDFVVSRENLVREPA